MPYPRYDNEKTYKDNSHAKAMQPVIFAVVGNLIIFTKIKKNMRFRHYFLLVLLNLGIISAPSFAQESGTSEVVFVPRKLYFSNSFDGALITTAIHSGAFPLSLTMPTSVNTPRFSYFWNTGFNLNYDFSDHIGLFTGLGLKNIGFITKVKPLDSTIKRRVYALGLPVGIRVGNLRKKTYGFIGGGVDLPFNYKEKGFVRRGNKDKFNEWFSDRTAAYMPYAFAGVSFKPGIYFKVQYYPANFMNPDYTTTTNVSGTTVVTKPYAVYDIQLLMFSIGIDIRYTNRLKIQKKPHQETMM